MSLKVKHLGSLYPLNPIEFDLEKSAFIFSCDVFEPNIIEVPYALTIDSTYEIDDFSVSLFAKLDINENDIYQLYDRERHTRIGWCFPLQALDSVEHDYYDNEHFLRYAFIAFQYLLRNCPNDIYLKDPDIDGAGTIRIGEFFSDHMVVIIISNSTLDDIQFFDISDYLPSFFRHGYFPVIKRDPSSMQHRGSSPDGNRLYIEPLSPDIENTTFIETLFAEHIAYENNLLLIFFYLYQVVELLLEQIFRHEQAILIRELNASAGNSIKTKDILEKAQRNSSEKNRLRFLVARYLKNVPQETDLKEACIWFLKEYELDHGFDLAKYLYPVRNFLFHQYRDFNFQKLYIIEAIVHFLFPFICDLINNFQLPIPANHNQQADD